MTSPLARPHTAGRLGVAGGILGVVAGSVQAAVGSRIPDWTGDKASPVGLGLLTVLLSLTALGAGATLLTRADLSPGRRTLVAVALVVPAALCVSTVGRLWYGPGILLLAAFVSTLAAGGTRELGPVLLATRGRGLISVLGAFELLMAVSAGPAVTIAVGVLGGVALLVAPWLTGRARAARLPLLLLGTVPFAALTWWSLAAPLLAVVALALGLTSARDSDASARPGRDGSLVA